MKILLTGSHGFIGSAVREHLAGHEIIPLERGQPHWDPARGHVMQRYFEGFDAVIHLAGENIAKGRWSEKRKKELFLSRCRDTWLLSETLSRLERPPKVVIGASAVGYFGDRGEEVLTEKSGSGTGFLADLCVHWEKATQPLTHRGIRVVRTRFGQVISPRGGVLQKLLPIYRLGLGGKLGSGRQWMSWIALEDVAAIIGLSLRDERLVGPINVVAPEPIRQADFAKALAAPLERPAFLATPAWLLRVVLGEMADGLLLSSQRAIPEKLQKVGYQFQFPTLPELLSQAVDSLRSCV